MTLDVGTGDGRLPYTLGRRTPERLFVGLDASADNLRALSGRAWREGLDNVVYVREAVEGLPGALAGVADRVTVVFPWGSLLAAVARPQGEVLRGLRAVCHAQATLTVVLSLSGRDDSEARRLGLPLLDEASLHDRLASGYEAAGFHLTRVRAVALEELDQWPSTWARRLAHGRPRPVFQIEARTTGL